MIDLHLRADDEAALAAAMPMLRGTDPDGKAVWITSGPHHALDIGFAVETTVAVLDKEGHVTAPAVLDPCFHANLRLDEGHPDRVAMTHAATGHTVAPATPRRAFA